MSKRTREPDNQGSPGRPQPRTTSPASKFNARVLRKLHKEIGANPGVDLISKFPLDYSKRLTEAKGHRENIELAAPNISITHPNLTSDSDTDPLIPPASTMTIVFPLSRSVQDILGTNKQCLSGPGDQSAMADIRKSLSNVIQSGEVLWRSGACVGNAVMKCSSDVVVKIVPGLEDYTECTSMQYLEENIPEIPAPRHLGSITVGGMSYIFMSLIPGTTLDKIWPQLQKKQKMSISHQLNELLLKLRQLRRPNDMPLGGVCGEGCKDARRHIRISKAPIHDSTEFENFLFSNPSFGGSVYIEILRGLFASRASNCVFTHGDVRPANIIVQPNSDGNYLITGLIDWEYSGFYPDYSECIKATNTLSSLEIDDWFLHLPECIAPGTHPTAWLVDRLWDIHVV